MEKLTPEKAKWLAERYYKGMEKREPSMAKIFYTEDFVLQDDGAVDLVRGIKEAEAFLQNMYNTWPDLKFELLKEPCFGNDGVTAAFLVRATSSRKSRRKFTGPAAQWEFASFYTVDLGQEKFCSGRCCFNMLDVYEMLLPMEANYRKSLNIGSYFFGCFFISGSGPVMDAVNGDEGIYG